MNKSTITTIIGAAALALTKNVGSSSRIWSESTRLKERFYSLNGFEIDKVINDITEIYMHVYTDPNFWDLPLFDEEGNKAKYAIDSFDLKNLSGNDITIDLLASKSDDRRSDYKSYSDEVYESIQQAYVNTSDLTLNRLVRLLFGAWSGTDQQETSQKEIWIPMEYMDPNLRGAVLELLDPEYPQRQYFFNALKRLIEHEFFHCIDPKITTNGDSELSEGDYWIGKRERETQAKDIAESMYYLYLQLDDTEQKQILDQIRNRDARSLIAYPTTKLNEAGKNLTTKSNQLYNQGNRSKWLAELERKRFFESKSMYVWMDKLESYFKSKGVL